MASTSIFDLLVWYLIYTYITDNKLTHSYEIANSLAGPNKGLQSCPLAGCNKGQQSCQPQYLNHLHFTQEGLNSHNEERIC